MNETDSLEKGLNQQLQKHYSALLPQYSHIVIIPRSGCHSCVDKADLFFKETHRISFTFPNL